MRKLSKSLIWDESFGLLKRNSTLKVVLAINQKSVQTTFTKHVSYTDSTTGKQPS